MKHTFAALLLFGALGAVSLRAQPPYRPFGVDVENLDVTKCNHHSAVGCPIVDQAAAAGVQWMRLFAIWHFLEPSNGSFDWGELPWQIAYANSKGIQVYLTAEWAPRWANGATINCSPATPNLCPPPRTKETR